MDQYPFRKVEEKWQRIWRREDAFQVREDPGRRKYYCLEMLPYPSGEIHMGHVRVYSIGDTIARMKRMRGFNVLHPIGFDSFGLPAENAALQNDVQPKKWTEENIRRMRRQLQRMGFSYPWNRQIASHLPEYYRWNQWFFLKMYEKDLAYRSRRLVNWCPGCLTVLANEQVVDGRCWRCETEIHQRQLEQWFLRITAYAEELLRGLDRLDGWPDRVLAMQRHWIGRSEGATIRFPVGGHGPDLPIFTTRLDTIFGATFLVLAPEHPALGKILGSNQHTARVKEFAERQVGRSLLERTAPDAEKIGIYTGRDAINPFSRQPVPIWVANFVLGEYGTGAIMGVPAHDSRDRVFARKYKLPIRNVVVPVEAERDAPSDEAFVEDGRLIDSGRFTGMTSAEARQAMLDKAREGNFGKSTVHYRLNDWGVSRQRYWGTPIPMIHCGPCGIVPVAEADLPVRLPPRIRIDGTGGSPLERSPTFFRVLCPRCGRKAHRETDTLDTFFDSSWYFFRYTDPANPNGPFAREKGNYWMPIDLYIGGVEHATMHLIYFRFFTMVLRDLGLIGLSEPAQSLLMQGMVVKDGAKMSKSMGNVVSPDRMVEKFGADATRLFCLFAAPPVKDLEWSDQGAEGCFRFLQRLFRLTRQVGAGKPAGSASLPASPDPRQLAMRRKTHKTIHRVTVDIEKRLHLNTAISAIMELTNTLQNFVQEGIETPGDRAIAREALNHAFLLLSPLAPHLSAEILSQWIGPAKLGVYPWPEADPKLLLEDEARIVIQVNGKVRGQVQVPVGAGEEDVYRQATAEPKIAAHLKGRTINRKVYLQDRLMNIVLGSGGK